ncbi:kinase-like domain-containing protein [Mycena olivaceomarginata]|nr:kinase-like domain-containing protein [Mycena olivaceomarginata]
MTETLPLLGSLANMLMWLSMVNLHMKWLPYYNIDTFPLFLVILGLDFFPQPQFAPLVIEPVPAIRRFRRRVFAKIGELKVVIDVTSSQKSTPQFLPRFSLDTVIHSDGTLPNFQWPRDLDPQKIWDDGDYESATEERNPRWSETPFEGILSVGVHGTVFGGHLKQDDKYPFLNGGNSFIYRGKLTRPDGSKIRVAIKMLRILDHGAGQLEEMLRRLKREADVWSVLKHRNILPLLGVCEDLAPQPVLVSPFCEFGHVGRYLGEHPEASREPLALGVGSGLQFLHVNGIIHGDLKVQNVLINKHGIPCICDFGISKIVGRRGFTTFSVGTAPYMAPELFCVIDGLVFVHPSTTTYSDIYSFALLVLEILIAEPPKARPITQIIAPEIRTELRPKRTHYPESMVSRRTWAVLDRCWSFEPLFRPPISEILYELTESFVPIPVPRHSPL